MSLAALLPLEPPSTTTIQPEPPLTATPSSTSTAASFSAFHPSQNNLQPSKYDSTIIQARLQHFLSRKEAAGTGTNNTKTVTSHPVPSSISSSDSEISRISNKPTSSSSFQNLTVSNNVHLGLDNASSEFNRKSATTVFNAGSVDMEQMDTTMVISAGVGTPMIPSGLPMSVSSSEAREYSRVASISAQIASDSSTASVNVLATGPLSPAILVPSPTPYFNPAGGPAQPPPPQVWQQPYPPIYRPTLSPQVSWSTPSSVPAAAPPPASIPARVHTPSPVSVAPAMVPLQQQTTKARSISLKTQKQVSASHYPPPPPPPQPQAEYAVHYPWQTPAQTPERLAQSITPMTASESVSSDHLLTPALPSPSPVGPLSTHSHAQPQMSVPIPTPVSSHVMSTPIPLRPLPTNVSSAYLPVPMNTPTSGSMDMHAPQHPRSHTHQVQQAHSHSLMLSQQMFGGYAASSENDYNSMNATLSAWEANSASEANGSGGGGDEAPSGNGNGDLNGSGDSNGGVGGGKGDGDKNDEDDHGDHGDHAEEGDSVKKRKKLLLACHFCRGRKLKCDGVRPTCGHCAKRGLECGYDEQVRRRGPGKRTKKLRERAAFQAEQLKRIQAGLPPLEFPADGFEGDDGLGMIGGGVNDVIGGAEAGPGPSTLAELGKKGKGSNRGRKRKSDMAAVTAAAISAADAAGNGLGNGDAYADVSGLDVDDSLAHLQGAGAGIGVDDDVDAGDGSLFKRGKFQDDSSSLHIHHLDQLHHHQLHSSLPPLDPHSNNHTHNHNHTHAHDPVHLHDVGNDVFKLDQVDESVLASLQNAAAAAAAVDHHQHHALDPSLVGVGVDGLGDVDPTDLGQVDPGTLGQVIQRLSGGQH